MKNELRCLLRFLRFLCGFLTGISAVREPNRRCTSDMHADAVGGFIGRSKSARSVLTWALRAAVNCLQIGA